MNGLQKKLFKRFKEYWRDKELAEKCGLSVKDICVHEPVYSKTAPDDARVICYKCGQHYEETK